MRMIEVRKRNGAIVDFDLEKIVKAVKKAIKSSKPSGYDKGVLKSESDGVAPLVAANIEKIARKTNHITIEQIHNNVEQQLMQLGYYEAAKSYILHREKKRQARTEERNQKKKLLNIEGELDPVSEKFSLNSLRVLESRYLIKDKNLKVVETPTQLFERIATHVGCANILYDDEVFDKDGKQDQRTIPVSGMTGHFAHNIHLGLTRDDPEDYEKMNLSIGKYKLNGYNIKQLESLYDKLNKEEKMRFEFTTILNMIHDGKFDKYEKTIKSYFDLMVSQKFMPNTPTIANAGMKLGQLSACFVLGIEDNIESIMDTAKSMAVIFKSGGGVGINYGSLREKGAIISSTSGTSSGPVSFMSIIDKVTDVVKQGGKRRGANMGILDSSHIDILEFIHAKETPHVLENFNVSVGINNEFWQSMINNTPYELTSPSNPDIKKNVNASDIFNQIAQSAWNSAEPGVLFFDNANKYHVMHDLKGDIKSTNPCGEQLLFPNESCNLGSINLAKFVKNNIVDWESLGKTVQLCVDFLDNVIDVNKYPLDSIDTESWKTRRIGLGVMGLADLLYILEIPYNSKESYELQEQIAQFISYKSIEKSIDISKSRGSFPYYNNTKCKDGHIDVFGAYECSVTSIVGLDWNMIRDGVKNIGLRNVYCTTVAPTGSISMIADCSSGIEPLFALAFEKKVSIGDFIYVNPYLEKYLKNNNIDYDEELMKNIAKTGSCTNTDLPDDVKKIFVTAMDIHWMDHVLAQAVWQRWIDNSIAKTINMPNNVTVEDVKNAYYFAHQMLLKGITIYRDGSRHTQVLYTENMENKDLKASEYARNIYGNINTPPVPLRQELKDIRAEHPNLIQMFDNTIPDPSPEIKTASIKDNIKLNDKEICPNCSKPTTRVEGCYVCYTCGVSFC